MKETPVFIKIDDYKDVLDIIQLTRAKIDEGKKLLARLNELKNDEDAEIEGWHNSIIEIEKRIEFIDRTLFEPESVK